MTVGKATALAAGLVGAVAVGVAIGPAVQDTWRARTAPKTIAAAPMTEPEVAPAPAPVAKPVNRAPARVREAKTREPEFAPLPAKQPGGVSSVAVSVWEPELRDRVKAVLNPGTKIELAADDFSTAEQFVTVAHAARNTQVPFVILKDRVLNEGQTLAEAIHEFKPELDAKAEVVRARAAAQADLTGN